MNGSTIKKSELQLLTADQRRAEIAFVALSELDDALNPDRPKPVAVLRRIVREAKQEIDKLNGGTGG